MTKERRMRDEKCIVRRNAHSPCARISDLRIIRTKPLQPACGLTSNYPPVRGLSGKCGQTFPQQAK